MTRSDLLELIGHGENSGVEFKSDDVRPEQLAKEVVALINFQGGRILLGVEDDGTITGIRRGDLERWVMDTVFGRKVHPMILPFYEEIQVDDQRRVAVVSVTQGATKPYVVRHNDREDIYVRAGSTSRLATREQQAWLFAIGGMIHAELLPVSGSGVHDLSKERLEDYLTAIVGDDELPTSGEAWGERLCGLGFMTERQDGLPVCTIAGLVLFGHRPRRLLRQAGIRWMAFKGGEKAYDALDDRLIDGPLVALWRAAPGGGRRIAEQGLIEVARYVDRMEVLSPGALQNTMTVKKMIAGQRSPRNPLVVEVLRDYGYVDARGMGVRNKIIPLLRALNGVEPEFEATEDYLRLTMRRGLTESCERPNG